ncbi:MAG TPA: helix-turn-helix domain-containing protein [Solirubrobacteraceae bacterium]|jgi:AcrR family transcriptional regulator|nr:helix-turn-helix domain-containing protein [Solirubrobacteraceae bacterium]
MDSTTSAADGSTQALRGTKATIVEAAVETLKARGFAGASAREIAKTGGFNQALVFYHFGSVQNLLLSGLDLVSERRMRAYRPAFEQAQTLSDLARLAGEIYREDLDNGYVTVLVEMVAGAVSDPELGGEVAARMGPWLELVENKVRSLMAGTLFEPLIPAGEIAFAIVALYLGVDMLGHLGQDRRRAESLLELGIRLAPLAQVLLPAKSQEER